MKTSTPKISSELVPAAEAARILTELGDETSSQNLIRYCRRHGLIEKTQGRFLMVNPARLADHRDNFSREVMKGEHLKPEKTPAKPKLVSKTDTPLASSKNSKPVTELDRARSAKAEKEEAQADRAKLELYKETRDLLSTAENEVLLGLMMTLFKDTLFGVNLSDDTDAILAVNNLPDARKKPTQDILKSRRRGLLQSLSDLAETEMARLDPHHSAGFRDRLKQIIAQVHAARQAEFAATMSGQGRQA